MVEEGNLNILLCLKLNKFLTNLLPVMRMRHKRHTRPPLEVNVIAKLINLDSKC